eukprot:superscaffoldBa00002635_g14860
MSSTTTGFNEEQQRRGAQGPVGMDYIPTEEERRVFKECNQESFWYRSVPFSVVSMAITQALVARGTLSASPRFGSLPKLAFQSYMEEEEPRRKPILYEDLRLKNRENYEVTLTQKAETLLKPSPEKGSERPIKEAKKNIYGDTWEE